jgi:hypothetical protein
VRPRNPSQIRLQGAGMGTQSWTGSRYGFRDCSGDQGPVEGTRRDWHAHSRALKGHYGPIRGMDDIQIELVRAVVV